MMLMLMIQCCVPLFSIDISDVKNQSLSIFGFGVPILVFLFFLKNKAIRH